MNIKLLILLVVFGVHNSSLAGGESHGGNTIICYDRPLYLQNNVIDRDAKITKAPELYDYWEHSQLSFYKLDLPKGKMESIVPKVLKRLAKVDPKRAQLLLKRFKELDRILKFVNRAAIPDINDFTPKLLPSIEGSYCYKRQTAFQQSKPRIGEAKFYIDKKIYDLMSEKNKAGLILHELIYEYSLSIPDSLRYPQAPHLNRSADKADRARYYNFLISSNFMEQENLVMHYFEMIKDIIFYNPQERHMFTTFIGGVKAEFNGIATRTNELTPDWGHKEIHILENGVVKLFGQSRSVKKGHYIYIDFIDKSIGTVSSFPRWQDRD